VALLLARGPAGAARAKDKGGRTLLYCAEQYGGEEEEPELATEEINALLRAAMW
jgi:hypothetical protein